MCFKQFSVFGQQNTQELEKVWVFLDTFAVDFMEIFRLLE